LLIIQNESQVKPINYTKDLEIVQEVNGNFTLSFTTFNHKHNLGYSLIENETVINLDGYDFKVKLIHQNKDSKTIYATTTFFELRDTWKDDIYGGTHTFNEFITWLLNGSGWTFTIDSDLKNESKVISNFGNGSILALINTLISEYDCEFEVRTNNTVHFSKQIGGENEAVQCRYGNNIKALSHKVDTSNIKTRIKGIGNGITATYTSPLANDPLIGIRDAEPITDERFTQVDSLTEYIKSQLNDTPEVIFELEAIELTEKQLGQKVWLIYEKMNIEIETRILSQTKGIRNNRIVTTSVVLGNTIKKSSNDILTSMTVEIDQNKKEYRSKFEQTNERITLEVDEVNESIATLEIKADSIETSVTNLETNTNARFTVMADQISSKVTAGEVESIFYQTANSFTFSAEQINFNGHVFGQGATFSGNLETLQDVKVGANITMQGSNGGIIQFPATGCWIGAGNTGRMTIETWNGLMIAGPSFDVSNTTVVWGNNKPVAVWG